MRVGIVCRKNEARSPNLVRLLSKRYPEIDFWSAGTSVLMGESKSIALKLLANADFPEFTHTPQTLKSQTSSLLTTDLVIVTEDEMEEKVLSLGFRNKVVSLESVSVIQGLRVHDPINLDEKLFNFEIIKYLLLSTIVIESFLGAKTVLGILPKNPFSVHSAYDAIKGYEKAGHTIINTGLKYRSPFRKFGEDVFSIKAFDGDWSAQLLCKEEKRYIDFQDELHSPARVLLSDQWRENINCVSSTRKLVLTTSPLFNGSGMPDSDSILGLLGATRLCVI
jgi:protein-tyrosine-phosphatase